MMDPVGGAVPIERDVEVAFSALRRRFTGEYKLKVLRDADACRRPGELGALLRREGLYFSGSSDTESGFG